MLQVSALYVYPIKSLGGIPVNEALLTERGLQYDRRWMLVDSDNRFLSQREIAQMALFKITITSSGLTVTYSPTNSSLQISFQPLNTQLFEVTVWDDTCLAQQVSDEADNWFSNILGIPCKLVYMPDDTLRQVDPKYADDGMITSFADAFPLMMISQASLDDLSAKVGAPIPMNRFRPNLVYTGGRPYSEDELASFSINGINFYGVKLCARCPIPGIDQDTAISGKEPIKTLASYRRRQNKIYFGQNLIHEGTGVLRVGDTLKVLYIKDAVVFD
jgi:uncharacterized protein YcbX